jgi:50S ribosomal protein L16 3-hydroxylase
MPTSIVSRLGNLSTAQFMRQYWQRKPLLIRQALQFEPLDPQQVLAQAKSDNAPSRLIEQLPSKHGRELTQWRVTHGPLAKIPPLTKPNWTVLLQAADTVWPALAQLMHRFRFIGDARLDDLMISVASDGGGVGPHMDSYDVFLLQASGQRHWRWGKTANRALQEDQPIKLLRHFEGGQTALLEAGDMLYLPAGWAHDGVAQGTCMTYSIGFRASTEREIVGEFYARAADLLERDGRQVRDPGRRPNKNPARIAPAITRDYETLIRSYRPTRAQIANFAGEHLSEPANHVFFDAPHSALSQTQFLKKASTGGLRLHHAARALYDTKNLFINGQSSPSTSRLLRQFFDQRELLPASMALCSDNDFDFLYDCYCNGWILLK